MPRLSMTQMNQQLKKELSNVVSSTEDACIAIAKESKDTFQEEDEDEEQDDDEDCDEIPESFQMSQGQGTKARASVSAEAYGAWNTKKEFVAPVIDKTPE